MRGINVGILDYVAGNDKNYCNSFSHIQKYIPVSLDHIFCHKPARILSVLASNAIMNAVFCSKLHQGRL